MWFSRLRIWCCHCCSSGYSCGTDSNPGLGTSICCRKKKRKKKRKNEKKKKKIQTRFSHFPRGQLWLGCATSLSLSFPIWKIGVRLSLLTLAGCYKPHNKICIIKKAKISWLVHITQEGMWKKGKEMESKYPLGDSPWWEVIKMSVSSEMLGLSAALSLTFHRYLMQSKVRRESSQTEGKTKALCYAIEGQPQRRNDL